MANRLNRRFLRAAFALPLLALPLTYGVASVLVYEAQPPRSTQGARRTAAVAGEASASRIQPAAPALDPGAARAADPAPAPPRSQAERLGELRQLAQSEAEPTAILELLVNLDADDPDARQLRAAALTALRCYRDEPRVAAAFTERACDPEAERLERVLALEGLQTQLLCLNRERLVALLDDRDPALRRRAQRLLGRGRGDR